MNKNLVILRCGRTSLHKHWLEGDTVRNWDLVLCPFQDIEPEPAAILPPHQVEGQKWIGIYDILTKWDGWRDYKYIWLPDDDLLTDTATINRLFDQSAYYEAKLSAPALSEDSYYSHPLSMRNQHSHARAVTFIEIMMPCLRVDALELVLPTIGETKSGYGWGLDFVWPKLLNYEDIMMFDDIVVRHTRPVGQIRDQALANMAGQEMHDLCVKYDAPHVLKTICIYDEQGMIQIPDSGVALIDYLAGYRYLVAKNPRALDALLSIQPSNWGKPVRYFGHARRGVNLALNKPALVSSVSEWSRSQDPAEDAKGGNDGIIDGLGRFHTSLEIDPWWQVDLLETSLIDRILIYNRLDQRERCTRVAVLASMDGQDWHLQGAKIDDALFGGADGQPYVFNFGTPFVARYVRIAMIGEGMLHLDQIEIFGRLQTP